MPRPRAIVIGATSGIGKALVKELVRQGYTVGATGRRTAALSALKEQDAPHVMTQEMDVSQPEAALEHMAALIQQLGGLDLLIICAGIGFLNPDQNWPHEEKTIAVNVTGFTAIANAGMRFFVQQGTGHLVGISSIAALRGSGHAPAYHASKAYVSNYLAGLRHKAVKQKLPLTITDIQPGFVDTALVQGDGIFWVATPEKAAQQIFKAIRKKKPHAYITARWRLIAWLLKIVPDALYNRLA